MEDDTHESAQLTVPIVYLGQIERCVNRSRAHRHNVARYRRFVTEIRDTWTSSLHRKPSSNRESGPITLWSKGGGYLPSSSPIVLKLGQAVPYCWRRASDASPRGGYYWKRDESPECLSLCFFSFFLLISSLIDRVALRKVEGLRENNYRSATDKFWQPTK